MSSTKIPEPTREVQARLDEDNSPLASYARELRQFLERESRRSGELSAANMVLEAEVRNLRAAAEADTRSSSEIEDAYYETVVRLTRASEYKDPESGAHIIRMGHYAETLAKHLGLGERFSTFVHGAAPMHDVGKIGVPDVILLKEGPLNDVEWEMMKRHPMIGARLLEGSKSPLLEMARQIALTHHERWDGSGYPEGLKGEDIPMAGRIVMLADTYDALRSERPYKKGLTHAKACDAILQGDARSKPEHFDPGLLEAFRAVHEEFDGIFRVFRD